MTEYAICRRCVMDTSDPEIRFDIDGHCNHCREFFERTSRELPAEEARQAQLAALVDAIRRRGQGREYDCIVGVSGGVDSTYLVYSAVRLGLRPLAIHVDNGWNSTLAVTNIHRTLNHLKVDLDTHVLDWEEFRDLQLAFLRASTPDAEVPTDHAIQAVLRREAVRRGVRYILAGSNFATEGIMPHAWSHGMRDWRYIAAVHRRFGTRRLRTYPHFGLIRFAWETQFHALQQILLLNYLDYDKARAMRTIEQELGWQYYGGKHYESIYTRFFQGYVLPVKFGFDKRRGHLSTLICSGQMTRDEALIELRTSPYPADLLEQDTEFVVKKLNISRADLDDILRSPPRKFTDYPSYERGSLTGPSLRLYRRLRRAAMQRAARRVPGQGGVPAGAPVRKVAA